MQDIPLDTTVICLPKHTKIFLVLSSTEEQLRSEHHAHLMRFFSGVKYKVKFNQLKIVYVKCRKVECRLLKVQINVEKSQNQFSIQLSLCPLTGTS